MRTEEWYRVKYDNGLPNVLLTNDQATARAQALAVNGDIETVKVVYQ